MSNPISSGGAAISSSLANLPIDLSCIAQQDVSKVKLAMQIPIECPHPNLLPPGEGTTSPTSLPLGETDTGRGCLGNQGRETVREAPVRAWERVGVRIFRTFATTSNAF